MSGCKKFEVRVWVETNTELPSSFILLNCQGDRAMVIGLASVKEVVYANASENGVAHTTFLDVLF